MSNPESLAPDDIPMGGQVFALDTKDHIDRLVVPRTLADHLFSEHGRLSAEQERKEFEAVGSELFLREEDIYPIFYRSTTERIAAGASRDEILSEMMAVVARSELPFASALRQAYEDALAGRPPKFHPPI